MERIKSMDNKELEPMLKEVSSLADLKSVVCLHNKQR